MARSVSKGTTAFHSILFLVLILIGCALVNFIGGYLFKRLDMTSDKTYTLSAASKDLVKNLPDRMNVKLFVSEDLKPPFKEQARFAKDLLSEYAIASKGKFVFEVIMMKDEDLKNKEPKAPDAKNKDPKAQDEQLTNEELARKYGIQKTGRGQSSQTKFEIAATYFGVGFDYAGKKEAIAAIPDTKGLEFEISSIIKKMSFAKDKRKKLAFATSEGELNLQSDLRIFANFLQKSGYETTTVDLKAPIPKDVDALFIVGPKQGGQDKMAHSDEDPTKKGFSERAKYVIDQFLMEGKGVGIFVDGQILATPQGAMIPGMDPPQIAEPNVTGIEDLLGHYGIVVKNDLVLDQHNKVGPVPYQGQMMGANHPVFVASKSFPKNHFVTESLELAIFPYVGSLELSNTAKQGISGVTFTELAKSSAFSWRPQAPFLFAAQMDVRKIPDHLERGPFSLAYAVTGKLKSFFVGKPMIKEDGSTVVPGQNVPGMSPYLGEAKQDARLLVIADSDFVSDRYLSLIRYVPFYKNNLVLAMNAADWLTEDRTLSEVRRKGMATHPLNEMSDKTVTMVKMGTIGGVPLFVCLFGMIRWQIRRARRARASIK